MKMSDKDITEMYPETIYKNSKLTMEDFIGSEDFDFYIKMYLTMAIYKQEIKERSNMDDGEWKTSMWYVYCRNCGNSSKHFTNACSQCMREYPVDQFEKNATDKPMHFKEKEDGQT